MFIQSKLILKSSSFYNGSAIATKYTCDGENISPQLSWGFDGPQAVGSYVLIVDDPDAQKVVGKTFVHWIALLPASITKLPEGVSSMEGSFVHSLNAQIQEMTNSDNMTMYMGPCPPPGSGEHTYRFTLFALTEPVTTLHAQLPSAPFTAEEFKKALGNKIIVQTMITAKYGK